MELPIDVVPNTNPPLFRWTQVAGTTGDPVQECEGMLPPSCETAVAALICMAKAAIKDNAMLAGQLEAARRREEQQRTQTAPAQVKPHSTAAQPSTHKK